MLAAIVLLACTITSIHDGDTMTVHCPTRVHPIVVRVAEIDAPELKAFTWGEQPGARAALAEAKSLCSSMRADVKLGTFDKRTNRWVAHVSCAGHDLSADLVQKGFAWSYYPSKGSLMPSYMAKAKAQHVGIWAGQPVAPSVWRKQWMH